MTRSASSREQLRAVDPRRRPGFTLLEVIIALALMVAMMSGIYEFYLTTIHQRQASIASLHDTLLMRSLLEQIADEIRQATDIIPGDGQGGFGGTEEQLTVVRMRLPDGSAYQTYDNKFQGDPLPGRQDLQRITYYRERDREVQDDDGTDTCRGLVREQSKILNPKPVGFAITTDNRNETEDFSLSDPEQTGADGMDKQQWFQPDKELIAPEIRYLKFEYLDGAIWHKTWKPILAASDTTGTGDAAGAGTGSGAGTGGTAGAASGGLNPGGAAGSLAGAAGAAGGAAAAGGTPASAKPTGRSALPQAIRVTIGTVKGLWPEDEDPATAEKDEKTWHPDRWSIEVYLRQADQTMLSSRQYGHGLGDEAEETVKQTQGGGQ